MTTNCQSIRNLITRLDIYNEYSCVDMISGHSEENAIIVSFLNAHAVNLTTENELMLGAIEQSDFLFRDGIGVKLMLKAFNKPAGVNLNGTDLIPLLISKYKGKRIAVFGAEGEFNKAAVHKLGQLGIAIDVHHHGFENDQYYVDKVFQEKPDLVILGFGMPRQEQLSIKIKSVVTWPCVIVNGGAIIDFIAGKFNRAPAILRGLGLEWLYRLYKEPSRLWRRYLLGNIKFMYYVIQCSFHSK